MDLSTLSDDELTRLYSQAPASAPPPSMDLSGISDDELRKMHGRAVMAPQPSVAASMAMDAAKTVLPGLARGVTGVIGFPNAALGFAEQGIDWAVDKGMGLAGLTPRSREGQRRISDGFISQETALKPVEAVTGELYKPKTIAGEAVNTLAEFAPNALFGGGSLAQRLGQVAGPAFASEGAGQATRQLAPEYESYARIGGALTGGIGAAVAQAPRGGQVALRQGLLGVTPEELTAAQGLRAQARELPNGGIALPLDEALAKVTDGRTNRLSQVSRVVTNSGGPGAERMAALYAARPGQIDRTASGTFDMFGPVSPSPSAIGFDVQDAARAGMMQTPEGMALAQARAAAGPRMTAYEAGQQIQPALRAQADMREAVRKGQAARDYNAARNAPENAGIERTLEVERPGDPITTQPTYSRPQFEPDAPRPLEPYRAAAAEAKEAPPKSLARFIAEHGGLSLDGDARATDLHKFVVPGVGKVARPDGKSLDSFWRERLIEEGYFRPDADGGMARDISSELLRKLQNEQRGVPSYPLDSAGRKKGRSANSQTADDYANDLSLAQSRLHEDLTRVGVDPASVHPDIQSRVVGALVRGEHADPLHAYERVVGAMKGPLDPYVKSTTVTETIPDVRFGQVNPQPALEAIAGQSRYAKGDVRGALGRAERDLYEPGGAELDMSVQGLLKARERLDFQIEDAFRAGDRTKGADLQATRAALDAQLKTVPEVATADANFAANSRPLEPFTANNAPLARVAQRDDLSGRMAMPAEQVPGALQGPSAMRELLANVPAAREAQGRFLATRILDAADDGRGGIDAGKLMAAMRDNLDTLKLVPDVAQRLQVIAQARNGMNRLEATPLGQLAANTDTRRATETLFPRNPLAGSQGEIGGAMGAVARNNPRAANDITRQFFENLFNSSTRDLKGGPAQYGGAGFAAAARGNSQQRKNLDAALSALPNAADKKTLTDRFLTALEATGYKPQKGSDTVFNSDIRDILANGGGPVSSAIAEATKGGAMGAMVGGGSGAAGGAYLGLKRGIADGMTRYRMGRGGDDVARMLTDPSVSTADLMALLRDGAGRPSAQLLMARLFGLGAAGGSSGNTPNRSGR